MSSSVFPLYMLPTMTSIQPWLGSWGAGSAMAGGRYRRPPELSTLAVGGAHRPPPRAQGGQILYAPRRRKEYNAAGRAPARRRAPPAGRGSSVHRIVRVTSRVRRIARGGRPSVAGSPDAPTDVARRDP